MGPMRRTPLCCEGFRSPVFILCPSCWAFNAVRLRKKRFTRRKLYFILSSFVRLEKEMVAYLVTTSFLKGTSSTITIYFKQQHLPFVCILQHTCDRFLRIPCNAPCHVVHAFHIQPRRHHRCLHRYGKFLGRSGHPYSLPWLQCNKQ